MSIEKRERKLNKISELFFPTVNTVIISRKIDNCIRSYYERVKFDEIKYNKRNKIISKKIMLKNDEIFTQKLGNIDRIPTDGFMVVGLSGVGKTRTVKKFLSYYPRVITHKNIFYKTSSFYQIPYLYLNCSIDASVKDLCISIIDKIDETLIPIRKEKGIEQHTYRKRFVRRKVSTHDLTGRVIYLIEKYFIGTIIIDEIQNLKGFKSSNKFLNFIINMTNETNTPVIYIGTHGILDEKITKNLKWTRRITGQGIVEFDRLSGYMFGKFLKDLWEYKVIEKEYKLTVEIMDKFKECTAGIVYLIVRLFIEVQRYALNNKKDINLETIELVFNARFGHLKKIIFALNENNFKVLEKYEDLVEINKELYFNY